MFLDARALLSGHEKVALSPGADGGPSPWAAHGEATQFGNRAGLGLGSPGFEVLAAAALVAWG
jgi:hypothetical protein